MSVPTRLRPPVSLAEPGSFQPKASGMESFFCAMKAKSAAPVAGRTLAILLADAAIWSRPRTS